MDCSTFSNKTTFTEAEEVTNGELSERYYLLKKQFESLSSSYEASQQELHETRRSYQTALDVQRDLTTELESIQVKEEKRRNDLNSRLTSLQEENNVLKIEHTEALERHTNEINKLEDKIRRLKEEQNTKVREATPERDNSELDDVKAALASALCDASSAKEALEEARAEVMSWRMRAEELVGEMGEMRATVNLKREELQAANEREAAALADLAEVRAMMHQCTNADDLQPHAAKGNSIFAEVEDKRQEMAKNLIQMKQTVSRLRRELANKQLELEALLHEKQTIWEQQAGAAAHYDRQLIESYEDRITQLEGECERQRRELARWFNKHSEPTAQGWLSGVLDHLKSECERLRAEVLSRGAAELASAAQVRELRRKMALLSTSAGSKPTASPVPTTTPPSPPPPPPPPPPPHAHQPDAQHVLKPVDTNVIVSRPIGVKEHGKENAKERPRLTADDVRKKVSFN